MFPADNPHVAAALDGLTRAAYGERVADADLSRSALAFVQAHGAGFAALASYCLDIEIGPGAAPSSSAALVRAAATTTESFPAQIVAGAAGVARGLQTDALADVLAIASPMTVQNYKPQAFSAVDLEGVEPPSRATTQKGERQHARALTLSEAFQTETSSTDLSVSLEALAADDRGYVLGMLAAYASKTARIEHRAAFGILADNPVLSDTRELFNVASQNLLTGTALDVDGFDAASEALAKQPTLSGEESIGAPRVLAVPSAKLGSALALVESLGQPVRVVSSPVIGVGTWYLFADPGRFPIIARALFAGADSSLEFAPVRPMEQADGLILPASHSVAYAPVSRIGAVRVEN
jgi:hypothetical protein